MLYSKVTQLYIHIYILFIEYSSLCYTVGLCHLAIPYIIAYIFYFYVHFRN